MLKWKLSNRKCRLSFHLTENALAELTEFGTESVCSSKAMVCLCRTIARREELYHHAIDYFEQVSLGRKQFNIEISEKVMSVLAKLNWQKMLFKKHSTQP